MLRRCLLLSGALAASAAPAATELTLQPPTESVAARPPEWAERLAVRLGSAANARELATEWERDRARF